MYLIFKVGVVLERSWEIQHLSAQCHKMSRRIPSPIDAEIEPTVVRLRLHQVLVGGARNWWQNHAKMSRFIDFHPLSSTTFQHHAGLAI